MPTYTRMNLDLMPSKGDIGAFAFIASPELYTDTQLEEIAAMYDLVLTSYMDASRVTVMRTENPSIKILLFNNPYFRWGDDIWGAANQAEVDSNFAPYNLLDPSDNIITYGGTIYPGIPGGADPLCDPRVTAYQTYYAAQVKKYVDLGGYDGIFADTVNEDIVSFMLAPGGVYPKNYTVQNWADGNIDLASATRTQLNTNSDEFWFNGVSRSPGVTTEQNASILAQAHGSAVETFSIDLAIDKDLYTKSEYFPAGLVGGLKGTTDQGKGCVIEVYTHEGSDAARESALAAYLMVMNKGNSWYYHTTVAQAGFHVDWAGYRLAMGDPDSAYQTIANGLYLRWFDGGAAVYNSTLQKLRCPISGNDVPALTGWIYTN